MAVVRWTFEDSSTSQTYEFDINPSEGGSPAREKNFQFVGTVAPDGKTLIFEGLDAPQKLEWSGTILEEDHYNAFVTWWAKRHQIQVTDDLGRTFTIIIERFDPRRERAVHYPWKHSYTITAVIVDWPV